MRTVLLICVMSALISGCRTFGAANDGWKERLGQRITLEGVTENYKVGAALRTDDWAIYIDLPEGEHWPLELNQRSIRVTGTVIERYDLPVIHEDETDVAGIPVPVGTDLHEASHRYLLTDVQWEFVSE